MAVKIEDPIEGRIGQALWKRADQDLDSGRTKPRI